MNGDIHRCVSDAAQDKPQPPVPARAGLSPVTPEKSQVDQQRQRRMQTIMKGNPTGIVEEKIVESAACFRGRKLGDDVVMVDEISQ